MRGARELILLAEHHRSSSLVIANPSRESADFAPHECHWDPDEPNEIMSLTKPIVSLVVARAVTLGFLKSIDVAVQDIRPQWDVDSRLTLRDLMTHTSGLKVEPAAMAYESPYITKFALGLPQDTKPGARFAYNNPVSNLVPALISAAVGEDFVEFAKRELFVPLGVRDFSWQRDHAGNPLAMAGLHMRARDVAAFGELILRRGQWNRHELLSGRALAEVTVFRAETGPFWFGVFGKDFSGVPSPLIRDGIFHSGDGGQYLVVMPRRGLAIVRVRRGTKKSENTKWPEFIDDVQRILGAS